MKRALNSARFLWFVFACIHAAFANKDKFRTERLTNGFSSSKTPQAFKEYFETDLYYGISNKLSNPKKLLPKLKYMEIGDLYRYDSNAGAFRNLSTLNLIAAENNWVAMSGFDPVRFSLRTNKDSVKIGEEFELLITTEYIKVNPGAIFTFEGSDEYTLKLLLPDGFISTGGDYYDFIKGKVNEQNPRKQYTLKGKFLNVSANLCFVLLRSHIHADLSSLYIKKAEYCNKVKDDSAETDSNSEIINPIEKFVAYRAYKFGITHTLPKSLEIWQKERPELIRKVEEMAGIISTANLPLLLKIHGEQQLDGYKVQNITFQVRNRVFATANLFIPAGSGPFPAVLGLHGHTATGRFDATAQYRFHKLARNGFVCLSIDTWGSGERTTQHGVFEYHGGNLGANLLNIGETLLGAQVMDNRRAIDLLSSLSFVDTNNIGVTGESGGGNQTMWIAALDERLKAAIPVVSVGTFEAYGLGHNCVCELLPQGMTLAEESGIIALIAPRNLRIFSANQETNTAFVPSEMLRTYNLAKTIFSLYEKPQNISYRLFDAPHSYSIEMADSMVVWFSQILKNKPKPYIQTVDFPVSTEIVDKQWIFEKGKRVADVKSISVYCSEKSNDLKSKTINHPKEEIERLFFLKNNPAETKIDLKKTDIWQIIKLSNLQELPVYFSANSEPKSIILHLFNKTDVSKNIVPNAINIWVGLFGKSEQTSPLLTKYDESVAELHTLARSNLWANESSIGIWYSEIKAVIDALKKTYAKLPISIKTEKEIVIATIINSINEPMIKKIETTESPLSYVFDAKLIGYTKGYMGSHIPGFLKWGDLADLVAISNAEISFNNARSFAGRKLEPAELEVLATEFKQKRALRNNKVPLNFN